MNKRYFDIAKRLSYKSDYKHRLGSVIVKKGKVIGLGINKMKTHPKSNTPYKTIHCEFDAVLNARIEDFKDCSIYIYRETPTGKIANSKPCKSCEAMLESIGMENVYYSHEEGFKRL